MDKPELLHRRMARCEWGDHWVHFKDLVKVQVPYERPEGSNYFLYSSYVEPYWTTGGIRNATIARTADIEPSFADSCTGPESYVCTDTSDVDHLRNGVVTWNGLGVVWNATTVDCSYMDNVTFSCEFGFKEDYHDATPRNVRAGFLINSVAYRMVDIRIRDDRRIWFTSPVDLLSDKTIVSCYVWCDGGKWWVDALQLARGITTPGSFYVTNGAVVDYSVSERASGLVNMCRKCRKKIKNYRSDLTI